MQNRVPATRAERPALPDFAPVPRKTNRHDGWTPARQKAFIEALADTGSVRRAAADAAIDAGGDAAADVLEDDPEEHFVRLPHNGTSYRGELLAPVGIEEWEEWTPPED